MLTDLFSDCEESQEDERDDDLIFFLGTVGGKTEEVVVSGWFCEAKNVEAGKRKRTVAGIVTQPQRTLIWKGRSKQ